MPPLHSMPPLGSLSAYCRTIWYRKRIIIVWLPDGEKSLRVCVAVSIEYRQTDGHTSCDSIVRAMRSLISSKCGQWWHDIQLRWNTKTTFRTKMVWMWARKHPINFGVLPSPTPTIMCSWKLFWHATRRTPIVYKIWSCYLQQLQK